MIGLLKKKMHANTLAAVCPDGAGVAVAQIRRDNDVPPMLELCEYRGFESGKDDKVALEKLVKDTKLDHSLCVSLVELDDYSLVMVEAPEVQPEELSIDEFFVEYDRLYETISIEGEGNSHQYLVQRSGELVQYDQETEDIDPLLDEIAQLRQQVLDLQTEIIELNTEIANG